MYAELHCHSHYSLLDGASSPEDLVRQAAALGLPALALTDHDNLYAAVRFSQAAQEAGIQPIFGAEMTLDDDSHITLLVENEQGWGNLCQLITLARHNAPKGEAALSVAHLADYSAGLIALSGCAKGAIPTALRRGDLRKARQIAQQYRDGFGVGNFWIELQHHLLPHDSARCAALVEVAQAAEIGVVATNNVHYARPEGHRLQDVLVCIRHNLRLDDAAHLLRQNSEYALKSAAEMERLFAAYPQALTNTLQIAARCTFSLRFGLQTLPTFPTPDGLSAAALLEQLCRAGLQSKGLEASAQARRQMRHELAVIQRCGLSNYFLMVADMVRFAREQEILCQGRGSAANALVAYLLDISPINPLEHHLVFERFLSDERQAVPDIDMDFQADRREEVIQYIYQRYGVDHAAMACTFVTFRTRSALRDVGKALGLPLELLERASGSVDPFNMASLSDGAGLREAVGERAQGEAWRQLAELCQQIDGFPRHLGIHNGGMVIMGHPLAQRLPTEPASMTGRFVVQWDKDALETAGVVKFDILGLRMLSAIAEALRHIRDAGDVPHFAEMTDPAVYDLVSKADTIGVFQVESRAQAQMLPRMKPRAFNDLIVAISLIRPGPVQGDMVHPYLRRRLGLEAVRYPHPLLRPALEETLGVILFQEQVLKVARDLASFTAGQGEQLRRALGNKRAHEELERFHGDFVDGARTKGVDEAQANAIFDALRAFGSYSFPKSHAAAFAVIVYQSAWLKRYHPQAYYTALLNNQPMGFWSPAVLVNDAKRHGIPVLPVDINRSAAQCTVEGAGIRLGLNAVKGMGEVASAAVTTAREWGDFQHLRDLCGRVRLPRRFWENLILAGALDSFGRGRRKLIWELTSLPTSEDALDLDMPDMEVAFPPVTLMDVMGVEYEMLGLSLRSHVMALYRAWLREQGILSSKDLPRVASGRVVRAAGLVVVHQAQPTAKGTHFVTLEDEFGFVNVIVKPDIYARYRRMWRERPLLVVEGEVQKQGVLTNLVAEGVTGLPQ